MSIKSSIESITPAPVLAAWKWVRYPQRSYSRYKLKVNIVKYLKTSELDQWGGGEVRQIVHYLKRHGLCVFPYSYTQKYNWRRIEVYYDSARRLPYVMHEGKRLYFKRGMSLEQVSQNYAGLLCEQDEASPHRYETAQFRVHNGDVVVDAGTAEGNFALSVVERASRIYLFETEAAWIEALQATFAPYRDKIVIINKFVSDHDDDACITLDTALAGQRVDFIKADIEGAERDMLGGAREILARRQPMQVCLCTYHRHDDAQVLQQSLAANGFTTAFSDGYMIFIYDKTLRAPYLRRGLLRGVR